MLLNDLIQKLEVLRDDIADTLGDHAARVAEIRVAVNPAWAMQHDLDDRLDLPWRADEESGDVTAYLPDGGQVQGASYLPGEIAETLGWS